MLNSLLYTLASRKPVGFSFTFDTAGRGFDQAVWHDSSTTLFTFDDAEKSFNQSVWANLAKYSAARSKSNQQVDFAKVLKQMDASK